MKLHHLEDHNKERRKFREEWLKPRPSGIACPQCGAEMVEDRTTVMTSNPPQCRVDCDGCGFHSYKVV